MAKFSMVRTESAPKGTKRIFEDITKVKHVRSTPNFFKTLANSPSVLQGTWSAYKSISTRGTISEVVKEMIFVAISVAKKCAYCEAAHLDPETCTNLVSNLNALRPKRTRDIVKFAVKVAVDPGSLKDADYEVLKGHGIDDTGIIEAVAMSGFAMYAITVAEALKLEVDSWGAMTSANG